ncbi:MAG: 23S rRNA (adenine(2030)-N(6))-methyltransferase RlmJ [Methylomonas sp.]|nr:23S rRNA (adenine(2030)-N(6))-methyltransferase RlmJ [Methylomonas sp.]PPD19988.1 MAG: 23S rRNA (adenine(2030)-N(6))-methyltransferase RlmJ [Methylomonas sp.]PPD26510.1 MAG: 23S rRNA (adenine(2030)-N(6))-methyltransferase RlmJ [Methylomonas sp.]PPD36952.1 MAG: 23S rRNA (adenine(2030)-N(6))-methyltransferase RlmJ [Methylomonas sp.]PPD38277.1 MAG: 23S rRNA (adenine(2030)-N(6))-methyltransferase RlmJ [Methylomonas sp.]
MLSYRHGFHAGNFADVLKHSVLAMIVKSLKQKDKPFVYIDTHAGAGKYAFQSEFAKKTGEYQTGIAKIWPVVERPEEIRDYLAAVRAENTGKQLQRYPGSPQLVRRLIRAQDRMQLSELHATDYGHLAHLFAGDKQVAVFKEDGLERLPKKLPPIQRRGLILIDPSYELKSDYSAVVGVLQTAHRHFDTGIFVLWYPVIDRPQTERLLQRIKDTGIPRQLRIEQCVTGDGRVRGMTGSGLLVINPPWQLDAHATTLLTWLDPILSEGQGQWRVEWQVGEIPPDS